VLLDVAIVLHIAHIHIFLHWLLKSFLPEILAGKSLQILLEGRIRPTGNFFVSICLLADYYLYVGFEPIFWRLYTYKFEFKRSQDFRDLVSQ
jgi:hypothetical protein